MRRTLVLTATLGLLVAGAVSAQAIVFKVRATSAGINNAETGPLFSIQGRIQCTEGMHYNVRVRVVDGQGNVAEGRAKGVCGDPIHTIDGWTSWSTSEEGGTIFFSDSGFVCGTEAVARGLARTIEDGHELKFHDRITIGCG